MRRFLRPGHDPARERLKRDLFQFNKVRGLGDAAGVEQGSAMPPGSPQAGAGGAQVAFT